jgi:hypothetical protein
MKRPVLLAAAVAATVCWTVPARSAEWRAATESELKNVIPDRAPVEKERIETESRTASGITDGKGHFVAGVVLITAGYSADGKYSHFFLAQSPITIGSLSLPAGEYVFGFSHASEDALSVKFYEAGSGRFLGAVEAHRLNRVGRVESFRMLPPAEKPVVQIGRFGMTYEMRK